MPTYFSMGLVFRRKDLSPTFVADFHGDLARDGLLVLDEALLFLQVAWFTQILSGHPRFLHLYAIMERI
ncbi:hypothetical protein [Dysosmobacter sp.]|uniref:hypothetical protein n=1 Tax=Dysosmobacter sp. TaxID=2591382 RepID=UPI002A8B6592|nr:hypothetical protein [Dysosmobacter sp.]MDY3985938.1 hypothetical protein [Dysosmobacter sp.]